MIEGHNGVKGVVTQMWKGERVGGKVHILSFCLFAKNSGFRNDTEDFHNLRESAKAETERS